jgi:hypothetical protein
MNRSVKCIVVGLLILAGSIVWGQGYAWTASNYSNTDLNGSSNLIPVVHIDTVTSNVVIQAKASLHNLDGDAQYADCQLFVRSPFLPDSPISLDTTSVRLDSKDGGDTGSVALEGKFCAGPDMDYTVEMSCATKTGVARDAVLTAVRVPGLDGCSSFPTQAWIKPLPYPWEWIETTDYTEIGSIDSLPGKNYVVTAKTSMEDQDRVPQDGNCRLVATDPYNINVPIVLDITHVRPAGHTGILHLGGLGANQQAIMLQGTYCAPPNHDPVRLEVDCAIYTGGVGFGGEGHTVLSVMESSGVACAVPPPM